MKIFNNIREFFWPLLEDEEDQKPNCIKAEDINVDSSKLEKTLEYIIKRYEAEGDRRKTIESKSSLFIGSISVVTSVVLGVTSVLIKSEVNTATCFIILIVMVLTLYMSRTIWFSIQALERRNYHTLSVDDFLCSNKDDDYYKFLIAEITNKIRRNYITINKKVDSMVMAQEYFKRSLITMVLFSFGILFFFITKLENVKFHFNLMDYLNQLNISAWNTIFLYLLTALSLFLTIRKLRK